MFFLNGKQIAKTLNQIHKCNNVPSVLLRSNHIGKQFFALLKLKSSYSYFLYKLLIFKRLTLLLPRPPDTNVLYLAWALTVRALYITCPNIMAHKCWAWSSFKWRTAMVARMVCRASFAYRISSIRRMWPC